MPQRPNGFLQTYVEPWAQSVRYGSRGVDQGTAAVEAERTRDWRSAEAEAQRGWRSGEAERTREFNAPFYAARAYRLATPLDTGLSPEAAAQWAQKGVNVPQDRIGIDVGPQNAQEAAAFAALVGRGVTGASLEPFRQTVGQPGPKQFAPQRPWWPPGFGQTPPDQYHPYLNDEIEQAKQAAGQMVDDRRMLWKQSQDAINQQFVRPSGGFASAEEKFAFEEKLARALDENAVRFGLANKIEGIVPGDYVDDPTLPPVVVEDRWFRPDVTKPAKRYKPGNAAQVVDAWVNQRPTPQQISEAAEPVAQQRFQNRGKAPSMTLDRLASQAWAQPAASRQEWIDAQLSKAGLSVSDEELAAAIQRAKPQAR